MTGNLFLQAVTKETGRSWEKWTALLHEQCGASSSLTRDDLFDYLTEHHGLNEMWADLLAEMYGQRLGRTPVGQTKDAGVNMGVRRTVDADKEQVWRYLLSKDGLKLWIGELDALPLGKKESYETADGVRGEIRSVLPGEKIRLTWQPPDWDNPSILQLYLLSARGGGTTVSFHQEKLDDLYMRKLMLDRWKRVAERLVAHYSESNRANASG